MPNEILLQSDTDSSQADGRYCIETIDQDVYLTVYRPTGDGKKINESAVIEDLKQRGLAGYQFSALIQAVKAASGQPVKIAEAVQYEAQADIRILVSRDRMEATGQVIKSANSKPVLMADIEQKLAEKGIAFGIQHAAVQRLLQSSSKVTIASGQAPQDGDNAYVKYHVEVEAKARPEELANGKVDFRNLNLCTTVEQGQLLAEKVPATAGTPGTDVFGNQVLSKPGRDVQLPAGKNTQVIDGDRVVAAIDGQLLNTNGKLTVMAVFEVRGDVDLSVGNINFTGNVVVRGSVQHGFTIKAGGDVQVYGTVSGGTVEGKNIEVKMGIQGVGRGYIRASGNITARFIENAVVHAGNDVVVSDVIFHSKVHAGRRVVVQGKRGLISGGRIVAGEEIVAKTVGSQMATGTELEVGVNPEKKEEYKNMRKKIGQLEDTLDQAQKGLKVLKAMDQNTLSSEKRELLLKLTKSMFRVSGQLETGRKELAAIEHALEEMKCGRVRISDMIYPGSKLVIGSLIKPITEPLSYISFSAQDGEVKIGSF